MKKNFALLMVVVLVLGFATCNKKQPVGSELTIQASEITQIVRGEVAGKTTTLDSWVFIEVRNPADDLSYGRFTKMVILDYQGIFSGAAQINARKYKVGDEIYFTLCWSSGNEALVRIENLIDYNALGLQVHPTGSDDIRIVNPKK